MKIAVAGATGVVGSHVMSQVRAAGHEAVGLARTLGADVVSGEGVQERLEGVDVLVNCVGTDSMKTKEAVGFFEASTRTLLSMAQTAGVSHHVVLSIVGIDEATSGYYAGKVYQERAVREAGLPFTILRSTQFHEFAEKVLKVGRVGPFVVAPQMRCAPVAASEVAAALVELASGSPKLGTVEMSGPQTRQMVDLVRQVGRADRVRARVMEFPMPGSSGKLMRDGSLLPHDPWRVGQQPFEAWLADRPLSRG